MWGIRSADLAKHQKSSTAAPLTASLGPSYVNLIPHMVHIGVILMHKGTVWSLLAPA